MLLYEKYVWISQTDQLVYMSNDSNNMYAFVCNRKSVKIKSQYNVAYPLIYRESNFKSSYLPNKASHQQNFISKKSSQVPY